MDKKALTKYLALTIIMAIFLVLLPRISSLARNIKNYYSSARESISTNDSLDGKQTLSVPSMRLLTADLATTGKLFKVAVFRLFE